MLLQDFAVDQFQAAVGILWRIGDLLECLDGEQGGCIGLPGYGTLLPLGRAVIGLLAARLGIGAFLALQIGVIGIQYIVRRLVIEELEGGSRGRR